MLSNQRQQMLPLRTAGDVDLSKDSNTGQRYRFEHLTLSTVLRDMYFTSNDPVQAIAYLSSTSRWSLETRTSE